MIWEDKLYINADGIVTTEPNAPNIPGEGNGLMVTGLAAALGMYPYNNTALLLERCRRMHTPLFYRSPYKQNADDQQKCDDYWGIIFIASRIHPTINDELLEWGRTHAWHYDVQEPERRILSQRFGRYPCFIPMLKLGGYKKEKVSAVEWLGVYASLLFSALFIGQSDGNMKATIRMAFFYDKSDVCRSLANFWLWRIKRRYGILGKSFVGYLKDTHPLCQIE